MRSKLLLFITLIAALKVSAQSPLVLRAQANYLSLNGVMQLQDSFSHIHHNGRNSFITVPPPSHAYPHTGIYNADTTIRIRPNHFTERYSRTFNTAGLITSYKEETINLPQFFDETLYVYNAAMLLDTVKWLSSGGNYFEVYSYNGGNTTETNIYQWSNNSNGWEPYSRRIYNYNSGKLVELKTELWQATSLSWALSSVDSFIVAGPGSDSIKVFRGWNNTTPVHYRNRYIRDLNNRVLLDSAFKDDIFISSHQYNYDPQGKLLIDSATFWYPQLPLLNGSKWQYNYDAQSNLVSIRKTSSANSVNIDSFTYNSSNLITSRGEYDSTATGLVLNGFGISYFYYEFPVNVTEITFSNTLRLYPIPATSYINISMSFTKPQPFSIRVFDMQGRLVSNWQEATQKQYNKQIPLTNMAPGQYILHIWAGDESVSRQFTVVR